MVTMVEILERTAEELILLVQTTVSFGLYYFSKMDEVHIISNMFMDEVGISMLATMSQKINNGDQGSNNGSLINTYTTGDT